MPTTRYALALSLLALPAVLPVVPARQQDPAIVATFSGKASPLQGKLALTPGRRANEVRARVTLTSGPSNAQLGWIIRQGTCDERGAEYGPVAAYRPLMTRGDGSAELAVNLPVAMPKANTYHIDILRERGSDVVLACGGLAEEGAPG